MMTSCIDTSLVKEKTLPVDLFFVSIVFKSYLSSAASLIANFESFFCCSKPQVSIDYIRCPKQFNNNYNSGKSYCAKTSIKKQLDPLFIPAAFCSKPDLYSAFAAG